VAYDSALTRQQLDTPMDLRSSLGTVTTVLLIGFVAAMLIGQQLGQPILLGFVLTGSMNAGPADMAPGDGFVAIPPALAGEVESGDVVTFNARELQGGGLTTHRVVGETDEGYITRGDANPFTDQDGPEPPVREAQIVAVAFQPGGDVLVIPRVGLAVLAMQGVFEALVPVLGSLPGLSGLADGDAGSIMTGAGGLLLVYSIVQEARAAGRRTGTEGRSRDRRGKTSAVLVLVVILVLILVPATASMAIPSETTELTIVSSQSPSDSPTVIERGGNVTYDYNFTNEGFLPRVGVVEPQSTGVTVDEPVIVAGRGESAGTTVTISAPEETGAYIRAVSQRQYLGILPLPLLLALHSLHPFVAIAAIDAVIGTLVTVVFVLAVGLEPFRFRSRDRDVSLVDQARRAVRKWL